MKQFLAKVPAYFSQADPTAVTCAAVLALGLIGAGAIMGLLMRGPKVELDHGSIYQTNCSNAKAVNGKQQNAEASTHAAMTVKNAEASDDAVMTMGGEE